MRLANGKMNAALDAADAAFEKFNKQTERWLLQAYRRALDEVRQKIAFTFSEADLASPEVQVRRFKRLLGIESQITEAIRKLTGVAIQTTRNAIKESYLKSFKSTNGALDLGMGMSMHLGSIDAAATGLLAQDTQWLNALKRHNGNLLAEIRYEMEMALRTNARQDVIAGIVEGKSYKAVANAIEERFNVAAGRASLIAFTELHRGHTEARLEGIRRGADAAAKLGIKTYKTWKHNHIGVPRETHLAADGQQVAPDEQFNIGGVMMDGPGLSGDPAEDCNCHCSAQLEMQEAV